MVPALVSRTALALAGAVLALLAASAASADVPAGMTLVPALSTRAAWVAGKPVNIYCASTDAAWNAYIATLSPQPVAPPYGVTPADGGSASYLSPRTCAPMFLRLRKRAVSSLAVGATIYVLTVEALHDHGEINDGTTACDALHLLPSFLVAKWGFRRGGGPYTDALRGARNFFAGQPPQYHTGGCG